MVAARCSGCMRGGGYSVVAARCNGCMRGWDILWWQLGVVVA